MISFFPRVRFAPSPTGPLHIGGLRTALYNYFFAKKYKGTFILRLEDTDQSRFVEGSEDYILEALKWLKIIPDEGFSIGGPYGPYRQSERKEIYFSYVQVLLKKGFAYYAFDKVGVLENFKKEALNKGEVFNYGPLNRDLFDHSLKLNSSDLKERLQKKEPYVIRFKMPKRNLEIFDQIRGKILINTELLDDKILLKSDGIPTYHLANVIDDHLMKISHVIRGEEWLSSLALHFLLYEAFGWSSPKFAHLPLILKSSGKGKLSKRDVETNKALIFPLNWKDPKTNILYKGYKESGFFPEAFINMLALLGWNPGDKKEIFDLKELINEFSLEKINKSGAKFNLPKAIWINSKYLQIKSKEEILALFLEKYPLEASIFEKKKLKKILTELTPRATSIEDIYFQGDYFFVSPKIYDENSLKKIKNYPIKLLKETKFILKKIENFSKENIKKEIENFVELHNLKFVQVVQPLRISVVGGLKGADLFFILKIIGKEETIKRIEKFISYLENKNIN